MPGEERNDIAPEIGGGRIAVQKNDRIAVADLDIAYLGIENLGTFPGVSIDARKRRFGHGKDSF
jgi:hypothetical protein